MNRELTPSEAADLLRMDQNKVTQLLRQGELRGRRKYKGTGKQGRWLIPEQAVEEYKRACA